MNDNELDTHVKNYYQGLNLRSEKLASLRTMAETALSSPQEEETALPRTTINQRWLLQRNLAVAATALICIVSLFQFMRPDGLSEDALAMLVSREIALNHNKGLLPEVKANNYSSLNAQLDKLDFSLLQSKKGQLLDLQLIGARYCSIHGQLATQIRLLGDNGEIYTLYQTQLNEELQALPEEDYEVDGVHVQQWQEAGLFFSLAQSTE